MGALAGLFALGQPTDAERTYAAVVEREAANQGIEPAFVQAVIWVESRFNPQAVGREPGGTISYGLMQLLLSTAREVARNPSLQADDLFDPALNVRLGTAYLAWQLRRYGGRIPEAVAAYNAGRARRDSAGRFVNSAGDPKVQAYVDQVLSRLAQYRQRPAALEAVPDAYSQELEAAYGRDPEPPPSPWAEWPWWWGWAAGGGAAALLLLLAWRTR